MLRKNKAMASRASLMLACLLCVLLGQARLAPAHAMESVTDWFKIGKDAIRTVRGLGYRLRR